VKKIGFALVTVLGAVVFAAAPASADTPAPAPAPVVVAPTTTADVVTPAPARRGLFGRFRDRRGTTAPVAVPYSTTPGTIVTAPAPAVAAPAATPVPTPMPMPAVKPISGITTDDTGVTTAAFTTTEPAAAPARRGLFSRTRTR